MVNDKRRELARLDSPRHLGGSIIHAIDRNTSNLFPLAALGTGQKISSPPAATFFPVELAGIGVVLELVAHFGDQIQ